MKSVKCTNIYIVLALLLVSFFSAKNQLISKTNFVKNILESPMPYAPDRNNDISERWNVGSGSSELDNTGYNNVKKTQSTNTVKNLHINNILKDPKPGSISTSTPIVCDGETIKVDNLTAASDGGLLAIYNYRWQASYDNGKTWTYASDETASVSASLAMTVYEGTILVRRQVRVGLLSETFYYTLPVSIQVVKNHISYIGGNNFAVAKGNSIIISTINTIYQSNISITDQNGNPVTQGQSVIFNTVGTFTYNVTAKAIAAPACQEISSITVDVYDLSNCKETTEKVFATSQSWSSSGLLFIPLGSVTNPENAIDNDMSTFSEIGVNIGLLGLGTTWQNLSFASKVDKGTPVKIKIGQDYSLLQVIGGISISAIDQNNNRIGSVVGVGEGALLDLLVGDNTFEFIFIPKDNNGKPIDYHGVRISLGSVLSVANKAKVYSAYYEKKREKGSDCTLIPIVVNGAEKPGTHVGKVTLNPFVDDVLWGVDDIGLGVATALSPVKYPYLAVDDDMDSYAIFSKAVALLNRQKLNVKLKHTARPGDEIRIIMGGFEIPLLDVSLLTDFKVQRYLGNTKVGPEVSSSQFKLLDLNLLGLLGSTGNRRALIVSSINQPFDRIEISYTSAVQVGLLGDYTYIYDVSIMPKMVFDGQDPDDLNIATPLCAADYLKVTKSDICTNYDISFAHANKSDETITSFKEIPNSGLSIVKETSAFSFYEFKTLYSQHPDNLYLKVQTKRQGCNYGDPQYLKINLKNCNSVIVNPVLKSFIGD